MCSIRLGDKDYARRLFVQPVHDSWAECFSDGAKAMSARQQRIDQRRFVQRRGRMCGHAARLVRN